MINSRASPKRARRSSSNQEIPFPISQTTHSAAAHSIQQDSLYEVLAPSPASTKSKLNSRRRPDPPPSYQRPYQAFSSAGEASKKSSAHLTTRETKSKTSRHSVAYESASESGQSVLSAFHPHSRAAGLREREGVKEQAKLSRNQTNSALRKVASWMRKSGKSNLSILIAILLVLWVKFSVSLGSYSGAETPPVRGDLEAQRHWIALTASSLSSPILAPSKSIISVPISEWYFHDHTYWGLDYPPLTAYHSLLLGAVARLTSRTAAFIELRPPTTSSPEILAEWEGRMSAMEKAGDMKQWLRSSVIVGDLLVWISAVIVYCRANFAKGKGDKATQTVVC